MEPDELKSQENNHPQTMRDHIIDFVQTLVVFLAIGSAIYLFIAQPHKVSGSSMYPNFHDGDYIITDKISYKLESPKRGDIIVFKNPNNEAQDFIKRIIGLPGDKVRVQDGQVYLNNKLLNEPYLSKDLTTPNESFLTDGKEVTVPEESYFTMGDNRANSSDSRDWGFIKKDKIIGKVFLRYWPYNSLGFYPAAYLMKQ